MADNGKMPMKDAAFKVLTENGGPMKSNDITREAIERKLIASSGKTPEATMAAQLSMDIQRKDTRFIRTRPATYGLKGRDRKGQKAKEAVQEPAAA